MIPIKQSALTFLRTGILDSDSIETRQKIVTVNLLAIAGMTVTGVMGVAASLNSGALIAIVLFVASFTFFLARYCLASFRNIDASASIILYSLYLLMFYLVYSGGVDNTGPLWIFLVAPVSLFLKGLRNGLINLFAFLLITCTLLFYPGNELLSTHFTHSFKLRLILSFLTTTFLSACYEYSRQQSYQYVKDLSLEYEKLSKYDPLTGVSNRRDATNKLEHEQRRIALDNKKLSIILCDVDHFKQVNDEFGHDVGDQVLIQLAELFSSSMRQRDLVARWGGEEFLIMLPDTDTEGAHLVAEKIHDSLAKLSIDIDGAKPEVTISMGVAEVNADDDIKQAISLADKYLYEAKRRGRNRTCSAAIGQTM